ncbi:hypothetical protein ACFX12_012339 [Malus domestica]
MCGIDACAQCSLRPPSSSSFFPSLSSFPSNFDEDNNGSRPFDGEHKIAKVVDGDRKPFIGDVNGEILPHDGDACQAYVR